MSERFLEGFIVDPAELDKLVGTSKLSAKEIRAKTKKSAVSDADLRLGEGDAKKGKTRVDKILAKLASGKLRTSDAPELVGMTTLVLNAYAKSLGSIQVPYVESHEFGLWNPVFKALDMPEMAKDYGVASLTFPFKKSPDVEWPITTLVEGASLAAWNNELSTDWQSKLHGLSGKLFTDKKHAVVAARVADTKTELEHALGRLKNWVSTTLEAELALALILGGDR
ncbi:MAG: hypothetical protein ABI591_29720 [Kofleriaceae bacterium]